MKIDQRAVIEQDSPLTQRKYGIVRLSEGRRYKRARAVQDGGLK
jgi:hypothetical protein